MSDPGWTAIWGDSKVAMQPLRTYAEDLIIWSSRSRQTSKSAAPNVHLAFSFASAVDFTRETIAATPTTNVRITVNSAEMMSSYVGHCTFLIFLFVPVTEEHTGLDILGSICAWIVCLDPVLFLYTCSCVVTDHLCGQACKLSGRRGCLEDCTKVGSVNVIFWNSGY